jgi:hypothetical protein
MTVCVIADPEAERDATVARIAAQNRQAFHAVAQPGPIGVAVGLDPGKDAAGHGIFGVIAEIEDRHLL